MPSQLTAQDLLRVAQAVEPLPKTDPQWRIEDRKVVAESADSDAVLIYVPHKMEFGIGRFQQLRIRDYLADQAVSIYKGNPDYIAQEDCSSLFDSYITAQHKNINECAVQAVLALLEVENG